MSQVFTYLCWYTRIIVMCLFVRMAFEAKKDHDWRGLSTEGLCRGIPGVDCEFMSKMVADGRCCAAESWKRLRSDILVVERYSMLHHQSSAKTALPTQINFLLLQLQSMSYWFCNVGSA